VTDLFKIDGGVEVRQVIKHARRDHGRATVAVKRKEPNTRDAVVMHVSPHVQFVRRGETRHGGHERRQCSDVPHRERNNSNPGSAIKRVDLQTFRNQWTQLALVDAPVHEEQLAPGLMHERLAVGPLANCHSIQRSEMFAIHFSS
jgi:hypothetical protein